MCAIFFWLVFPCNFEISFGVTAEEVGVLYITSARVCAFFFWRVFLCNFEMSFGMTA